MQKTQIQFNPSNSHISKERRFEIALAMAWKKQDEIEGKGEKSDAKHKMANDMRINCRRCHIQDIGI